jgi:hypothetical protein
MLRLGGARCEYAESSLARVLDACEPERGLADAGLACEHERCGPVLCSFDEGAERRELVLPADDVYGRRPT